MTTFEHIRSIVCQGERILPDLLLATSKRRNRELVFARQCIFYLVRKNTKQSLTKIGSYLGKDHATVLHSCKTIQNLIDTDKAIAIKVTIYEEKVKTVIAYTSAGNLKSIKMLKHYILNCIRDNIEIPPHVIEEYNLLIKDSETVHNPVTNVNQVN